MQALQYVRSVPRYLTARLLGPRIESVYTSPFGCLRRARIAEPELPNAAWVRVRPRLAGICGSDLATLTAQGSTYFDPFTSYPFVFGHEVVGEVVEAGAEAGAWGKGERVVLAPPLHCVVRGIANPCAACAAGRTAHCHNVVAGCIAAGIQTGFCASTGGGWSESLVAHASQLHRVPDGVPDAAAVLVEPFACCLHAAESAPAEPAGATALVLGAGTIGVLTIAALRAVQPGLRIVAVAKHPQQRDAARAWGADVVLEPRNLDFDLAALTGARAFQRALGRPVWIGGVDLAFDCVGSERTLDDALRLTRHQGTVMVVGMPAIPKRVDWTSIWHKELRVQGAYTSAAGTFARAVQFAAGRAPELAALPRAHFPLASYREAIRTALHAGSAGVLKVAFEP